MFHLFQIKKKTQQVRKKRNKLWNEIHEKKEIVIHLDQY